MTMQSQSQEHMTHVPHAEEHEHHMRDEPSP